MLPSVLQDKLGYEASEALAQVFREIDFAAVRELATKADIANLRTELKGDSNCVDSRLTLEVGKFNERLTDEIGKVNERITLELGKVNERLTDEIGKVNERITLELGKVNERLTDEIGKVNEKIAETKADIIKWVAAMLIAQSAVIAALVRLLTH